MNIEHLAFIYKQLYQKSSASTYSMQLIALPRLLPPARSTNRRHVIAITHTTNDDRLVKTMLGTPLWWHNGNTTLALLSNNRPKPTYSRGNLAR